MLFAVQTMHVTCSHMFELDFNGATIFILFFFFFICFLSAFSLQHSLTWLTFTIDVLCLTLNTRYRINMGWRVCRCASRRQGLNVGVLCMNHLCPQMLFFSIRDYYVQP